VPARARRCTAACATCRRPGACLRIDDPQDVPDNFNLVFDSGEPSRMCRVMWRSARQVGVRFE
jgi:hypothetical protein